MVHGGGGEGERRRASGPQRRRRPAVGDWPGGFWRPLRYVDGRGCSSQGRARQEQGRWHTDTARAPTSTRRPVQETTRTDGFGSDTDKIESGYYFLLYFNSDMNANANLIGYEYKIYSSNPDTFSIWNIELSWVLFYFVNNFIVNQNHYTSSE